jgi:hypothetical protein
MSELTAIDVLIDPDEAAIDRARVVNARLREGIPLPQNWELDATHVPHITTLQRYVRTAVLDAVYSAVENVIANTDMSALGYRAVKIVHADWGFPGYGPTVLLVEVNAAVLKFQSDLVAAIAPYTDDDGTADAFVADPGEVISPTIIDWVNAYVPAQIGDGKYLPHLTVGIATFEDLKTIEAAPFDAFDVHPATVSVYHLGNNGTARALLKSWPLES